MSRRNQNRRGFTLVETVIALAIILAISLAGLQLVASATRLETNNETRFYTTRLAEDTYACFRFAEDGERMLEVLQMLDEAFVQIPGTNDFELNRGNYFITVTADFANGHFSYRAQKPNGDVICAWDLVGDGL